MTQNDFITTINPFKDKMFRLAKRLLISVEEAEDATQEIIVKLWHKNKSLSVIANIEAYAITLTKNYCLDILKSKRATNLKITHSNYRDKDQDLHQKLENNDSLKFIEKWINELPEQQKIIIQMRDVEQYEFAEIAEILQMNEPAIRVALSRARKIIKDKLINAHQHGTQ